MTSRISLVLRRCAAALCLPLAGLALPGCPPAGPTPETVPFVDIERYAGLWFEIASNPAFFNQNLVGVTAEYGLQDDGRISVFNRGFEGSLDGPERSIRGTARVVEPESNAKLAVSFNNFFSRLFEGEYWIVLLDDVGYEYAVVTDSRQSTLFVLYREPIMPADLYADILDALNENQINTNRLRITGFVEDFDA